MLTRLCARFLNTLDSPVIVSPAMSGTFSEDLSLMTIHVSSEIIMFINEGIFAWAKMSFKDFALKTQLVFEVVVCGKWDLTAKVMICRSIK